MASIEERIEQLITKPVTELGYRIYDVQYGKEGKEYYLRIFIDQDSGIGLDDCEKVNNAITDILDEANYIKETYFLEISSPGVERILRKEKHLQEAIGKVIIITMFKPIEKKKEMIGTLTEFDEENIVIETEKEKIKIDRKNVASMKIYFDWN